MIKYSNVYMIKWDIESTQFIYVADTFKEAVNWVKKEIEINESEIICTLESDSDYKIITKGATILITPVQKINNK